MARRLPVVMEHDPDRHALGNFGEPRMCESCYPGANSPFEALNDD
jgi:hypothetical protein